MEDYLSKKYSAFTQKTFSNNFTVDMIAHELQTSVASATLSTRTVLGKMKSNMNFFEFSLVIEETLAEE